RLAYCTDPPRTTSSAATPGGQAHTTRRPLPPQVTGAGRRTTDIAGWARAGASFPEVHGGISREGPAERRREARLDGRLLLQNPREYGLELRDPRIGDLDAKVQLPGVGDADEVIRPVVR